MRIGILGGTFDPIHVGHLLMAEEARAQLDLEEVVFIPTGQPWMKEGEPISPSHHRLSMVRLGIASNPFFRYSSLEIDRPGYTYTVHTLEEMHRQSPDDDSFYFILGVDSLKEIHRWKEPQKLFELCTLAAASRTGQAAFDLSCLDSVCASASEKVVLLDGPMVDISGTEIRRREALGLSIRYQVPEEVECYIHRYGLYRDRESAQ